MKSKQLKNYNGRMKNSKFKEWWNNNIVKNIIEHYIEFPWYNFKQGVTNLWVWFPTVWSNRDWDSSYTFEVLKFKLKRQAKHIGDKDRHTSAKRDVEIMMLCVRLMDKMQDEFYGCEYLDYHKSTFDFIPLDKEFDGEKMFEMKSTVLSENFDEYFKKYPLIYKKVIARENYKEKKDIAHLMARENEKRAHKLLFKILERNIKNWWD